MVVAQQLYEGIDVGGGEAIGLITYMRTDSVTVAERRWRRRASTSARRLEAACCPAKPRTYRTRSKLAQEAHEAIRPTSVFREPEAAAAASLTPEQFRLYDLIWKRFVASQMASAVFDVTTVDVDAAGRREAEVPLPRHWLAAQVRRLPEPLPRRSGRRRSRPTRSASRCPR